MIIVATSENLFTINDTTGEIFTNSNRFDREQFVSYEITLQTTSRETFEPQSTNEVSLTVTIVDVNDVIPIFDPDTYNFDFDENSQENFLVGQVLAFDTDEMNSQNSEIRFSIEFLYINSSQEGPYLSINEITGEILVTDIPIDRETYTNITVVVTASDLGDPSLNVSIELDIIVNDLNDNTPEFNATTYSFNVLENSVVGTVVNSVSASDNDDGVNSQLVFSFQTDDVSCKQQHNKHSKQIYKQTDKHMNKQLGKLTFRQTSK